MSRLFLIVVLVSVVAAAPSNLSGQDSTPIRVVDLEGVDQMVADHHDLSMSLRIQYTGIDDPNDFNELFRMPGPKGDLVRAQGGLYAIFSQSVYARVSQGKQKGKIVRPVPPGTLFLIGRPMAEVIGPPAPPPPTRIDLNRSPVATVLREDHQLDMHHALSTMPTRIQAAPDTRRMDWALKRRAGSMTIIPATIDPGPNLDDDPWRDAAAIRTIATDPDYRANRMRALLLTSAGEG